MLASTNALQLTTGQQLFILLWVVLLRLSLEHAPFPVFTQKCPSFILLISSNFIFSQLKDAARASHSSAEPQCARTPVNQRNTATDRSTWSTFRGGARGVKRLYIYYFYKDIFKSFVSILFLFVLSVTNESFVLKWSKREREEKQTTLWFTLWYGSCCFFIFCHKFNSIHIIIKI